ncbi:hypothetical protein ERK20_11395 [Lactiplantibacillus plantarum]|nr:hypothetical protein [Lactiplantibacillus plantarum]
MVNTILKEADLFCPNSVRINFTIYHKKALDAFKKFKMSKYSSYTDSEAKDTAKAFHLLIEQNA